jgi:hypothetical protein
MSPSTQTQMPAAVAEFVAIPHDLRRVDPKFQPPRFAQYLSAVRELDKFAQRRFHRRVIHLAVRWMLDQGISVALWGGRHAGANPA